MAEYLGFTQVDVDKDSEMPGLADAMKVHAQFKDKKAIQRSQSVHPLFARGYTGAISVHASEGSLKLETLDGRSCILDVPTSKIRYCCALGNNVYVFLNHVSQGQFVYKCHVLRFATPKKAEAISFQLTLILKKMGALDPGQGRLFKAKSMFNLSKSLSMDSGEPENKKVQFFEPPSSLALSHASGLGAMKKFQSMYALNQNNIFGFEGEEVLYDDTSEQYTSLSSLVHSTPNSTPMQSPFGSMMSLNEIDSKYGSVINLTEQVCDGEEADENLICALCSKQIKGQKDWIALKQCGHEFHLECIETWREKHNACSVCRAPLSIGSFLCTLEGRKTLRTIFHVKLLDESESSSDLETTVQYITSEPCEARDGMYDHSDVHATMEPIIADLRTQNKTDFVKFKFNSANLRITSPGKHWEKRAMKNVKYIHAVNDHEFALAVSSEGLYNVFLFATTKDINASYIVDCFKSAKKKFAPTT